ncbi:MAG: polysaccharide deacetylase [Deltaproteobacteria bacterium]|nr:polysaccharide deacetylase [Deltaproteobacteria bacterium]
MAVCSRRTGFFFALLLPVFLFLSLPPQAAEGMDSAISRYEAVRIPFYEEDGTLAAAVRRFQRDGEERLLILDPKRFAFREMSATRLSALRRADEAAWRQTPFSAALARQTAPPYPLQNDGLRRSELPVAGFFLTADLCPAKKPLDRGFLEATAALPLTAPIPVALPVTGLWIEKHPEDLAWIEAQVAAQRLTITWVNHSYTHFYDPDLPLEKNFLLRPHTDFRDEALRLERLLLEKGLLPSPFFRFPGLVSDQGLIEQLRELCLIPLGADAWLAKGEAPRPGSVILVHGNGNEPEGIRLLLAFYESRQASFARGETTLLPLRDAFLPQ